MTVTVDSGAARLDRIPIPKIWVKKAEIKAFEEGWSAAGRGLSRSSHPLYLTYNARAAFRDGWDMRSARLKEIDMRRAWFTGNAGN